MRFTRIAAAIAVLSIAGTAHASWPFIQNNQVDDFGVAQQAAQVDTSSTVSATAAPSSQAEGQADAPMRQLPDCCAGARASVTPSSVDQNDNPLLRSNG